MSTLWWVWHVRIPSLFPFRISTSRIESFILCFWRKTLINSFVLKVFMTDFHILFLLGLIYILNVVNSECVNLKGVVIFQINVPSRSCFQQEELPSAWRVAPVPGHTVDFQYNWSHVLWLLAHCPSLPTVKPYRF